MSRVDDLGHPHVDRGKVEALAGFGLSPAEIARVLRVEQAMLLASCAEELDTGHLKANARVAEALYRKALGEGRESVAAAIFWLKTRAKWKETVVAEVRHDAADPLTALLQQVAESGRRIHDR